MFGAEPQPNWTVEGKAEFEAYASEQTRRMMRSALIASAFFLATILGVIPFLAGHAFHAHWERVGKYLLLLAMAELLWFVCRWGMVYSAWQSAREVRNETRDAE